MLCGSSATSEADSVKSRKRVMHFEVSILVENHQPRAYPFSQLVQFSSVSVKMLLLHVFLFYNFLVILMLKWYKRKGRTLELELSSMVLPAALPYHV